MRKITIVMRNGDVYISQVDEGNTPISIGQRLASGFIICEDKLWGKQRTLVVNLADVSAVVLESSDT